MKNNCVVCEGIDCAPDGATVEMAYASGFAHGAALDEDEAVSFCPLHERIVEMACMLHIAMVNAGGKR